MTFTHALYFSFTITKDCVEFHNVEAGAMIKIVVLHKQYAVANRNGIKCVNSGGHNFLRRVCEKAKLRPSAHSMESVSAISKRQQTPNAAQHTAEALGSRAKGSDSTR